MTTLQDRLLAGRAVRAAQEQEEFARLLRPAPEIPSQRSKRDATSPTLTLVTSTDPGGPDSKKRSG